MKKIISALALASLALGVATADVKFSLNYRTQALGFSRLINSPNDTNHIADEDYNYWLRQPQGEAAPTDTVSMTATTDYAGVTVRIDPNWNDGSLTLNQYSGYVKLGAFELGAGVFKDGKTQINKRLSGGNGQYQGNSWETVKLGSWFKGGYTVFVDDMVNFAGGDNATSAYLQWKGGPISVMGTLIGLGGKDTTWDANGTIYTGFGLSVLGKFDPATVEFIFKTSNNAANKDNRVLALYAQPNLGALKATLGGSVAIVADDLTEANVDLRLFQQIGKFSVAFDTNVSHLTNENDYAKDTYLKETKGNHIGARYLEATTGNAVFVENNWQLYDSNGKAVNRNTVMWNMLGFNFTATDWLSLKLSLGDVVSLHHIGRHGVHNVVGKDQWRGAEVFVAPGVEINAGKNAFICAYARLGWSNVGVVELDPDDATKTQLRESEFAVIVPVTLRVRF